MQFIETSVFTRQIRTLIDEEDYRAFQIALSLRPEQGAVIPGAADFERFDGARKVRESAVVAELSTTGIHPVAGSSSSSHIPRIAKPISHQSK